VRHGRRERLLLAAMLAPYLAGLALLVFLPALVTLVLAFTEYDLLRAPRFVGLGNFRELLEDDVFAISVWNSLSYVAASVPLRIGAALGLGLLLHRRMRTAAAARTAVYAPTLVPEIAYAVLWLWLLNPLYGPVNLLLGAVGAPTPSWFTDPDAARWAVILMGLFTIGEAFVIVLAVRATVPWELYELALVEGASPWQSMRWITLPLLAPALALLLLRDTILSFQASFVPALVLTEGGPPPYSTTYLPLFVYRNAFEYLRYGYAAAATLVLFMITAVVVLVQWRLLRRFRLDAATV
jgi:multiple sugar transport system permease protein